MPSEKLHDMFDMLETAQQKAVRRMQHMLADTDSQLRAAGKDAEDSNLGSSLITGATSSTSGHVQHLGIERKSSGPLRWPALVEKVLVASRANSSRTAAAGGRSAAAEGTIEDPTSTTAAASTDLRQVVTQSGELNGGGGGGGSRLSADAASSILALVQGQAPPIPEIRPLDMPNSAPRSTGWFKTNSQVHPDP